MDDPLPLGEEKKEGQRDDVCTVCAFVCVCVCVCVTEMKRKAEGEREEKEREERKISPFVIHSSPLSLP